jgi:hypothetical protein
LSFYDFSRANYKSINNFFNSFNWVLTFSSYDADEAMAVLLDAIYSSILSFVPRVTLRPSTFPAWFTPELKNLIVNKNRSHSKYKSTNSLSDYKHFSLLRAKCKFLSKKCYREFISRTESNLSLNPRSFWSFVRRHRSSPPIPSQVTYNGVISSNPTDTANLFSQYFSSVYTSSSPSSSPPPVNSSSHSFLPSHVQISINDVSNILASLRNLKSVGPDGIQGHFLFKLSDVLAWPLTLVFQKSLQTGVFPSALKLSSITPILKSGNPSNVTNYRPISILPHLSKVFETLVLNSIRPTLNNVLVDEQHGFRPGRSTTTCNLVFSTYIYDSFRMHSQVDVIYTDFTKAFDRVDHSLLINSLDLLGIGNPLLSWLRSYLTDRVQFISILGSSSNVFSPSSGVPQGAVLSPFLFALFINSATSVLLKAKLLIFADDMKLYLRINSLSDCLQLQADLDRLVTWGESLGLSLNIQKCSVMTFSRLHSSITFPYSINAIPIKSSGNSICDLGFTLTKNLCPLLHIEMACCKALKLLGFVSRISQDFRLQTPLKSLYCSLIRPILEYGSVLWDPNTSVASNMIERVQRKFLRMVAFRLNIPCPPHDYTPVLTELGLSSLANRRHAANLLFLSKLLSNQIDSPSLLSVINFRVPSHHTRSCAPFHIPHLTSNFLLNAPMVRLPRSANIDPDISLFNN